MQVLRGFPCCLHPTECDLTICTTCRRIWWRGACATELVRDNPPGAFLVAWDGAGDQPGEVKLAGDGARAG